MHKPPSSEGSNQCHRCDTEGNTAAVSVVNIHFVKVLEQLFLVTGAQRAGWSLLLKAMSGCYLRSLHNVRNDIGHHLENAFWF